MKVNDKSSDLALQDAVNLQNQQNGQTGKAKAKKKGGEGENSDGVDVKVGLASYINREFSPGQISNERQARVDELKKLIATGQYKPSSFDVAHALSKELSLSILTEGNSTDKAE